MGGAAGGEERYQWQAGRRGICMERSRAALTSVHCDTQRQQRSAHTGNEDRALVVRSRMGRDDDIERGKESRGGLDQERGPTK